ncbi:MAG: hypothetical protein ACO3Z6_15650, partial [Pseudomonadales bacterium]
GVRHGRAAGAGAHAGAVGVCPCRLRDLMTPPANDGLRLPGPFAWRLLGGTPDTRSLEMSRG